MQKIVPCLWFDRDAERAADLYTSIFEHARITHVAHYGEAGARASGLPKGTVLTVAFELEGYEFIALNGGPQFTFSPAVSFFVHCSTRDELERLWRELSAGGAWRSSASRCRRRTM
ncbi:MAG: VOC family protein, partial [Candidatus Sericytochromatia bacterium]|nr:VOC family protein [Candidatus Tanganyikabacteria bacterium]